MDLIQQPSALFVKHKAWPTVNGQVAVSTIDLQSCITKPRSGICVTILNYSFLGPAVGYSGTTGAYINYFYKHTLEADHLTTAFLLIKNLEMLTRYCYIF